MPVVLVPLTVSAFIGTLCGTRMTEQRSLILSSVVSRIGMFSIGISAPVVTTFGRRVVLFVFVTTIRQLPLLVSLVKSNSPLGAWRVEIILMRRGIPRTLKTLVVNRTAV